ncbi:hypothetical protein Q8791_07710 [Nocardiopsis sp. CT-R113]|uniref:Uncharacterized protein n=1 Tax=Nocardiopsis codii TaxID=3065942 RepID=A0ABU7K4J0_9ACTN|nr:hypothetical protein [Nocardiopsis sp. CT-R113]MEE2037104.1 hypothetical protein [Nocardiopsis sp. CT-R113]
MTFTSDEPPSLDGRRTARPATGGTGGRPHPVAVSVDTENHTITARGAA